MRLADWYVWIFFFLTRCNAEMYSMYCALLLVERTSAVCIYSIMVIIIKRQRNVAGISGLRPRDMIRNVMVDVDVDPTTSPSQGGNKP
jgi:hypothetical protein